MWGGYSPAPGGGAPLEAVAVAVGVSAEAAVEAQSGVEIDSVGAVGVDFLAVHLPAAVGVAPVVAVRESRRRRRKRRR